MRFVGESAGAILLARRLLEPVSGPRLCPRCERDLPEDAFQRDRSRPDGRYPICADCVSLKGSVYWATLCPQKRWAALARVRRQKKERLAGAASRKKELARQRLAGRDLIIARAVSRGAMANLAAGRGVDGRRSWRRAAKEAI